MIYCLYRAYYLGGAWDHMARDRTESLFSGVSKWKLEAAEEESKRYFFHIDEVNSLENGDSSIVIGRKGTGKTAICRYFEQNLSYNRFCIKLSFKEFPFNLPLQP